MGKNLSAFNTTKTYEITFSDLVSKCDVMQKWRGKQKTGKWPQVLIEHTLASAKTKTNKKNIHCVCVGDVLKKTTFKQLN